MYYNSVRECAHLPLYTPSSEELHSMFVWIGLSDVLIGELRHKEINVSRPDLMFGMWVTGKWCEVLYLL